MTIDAMTAARLRFRSENSLAKIVISDCNVLAKLCHAIHHIEQVGTTLCSRSIAEMNSRIRVPAG